MDASALPPSTPLSRMARRAGGLHDPRRGTAAPAAGPGARLLSLDGPGGRHPGWIEAGPPDRDVDLAYDWREAASARLDLADDTVDAVRVDRVLEQVRDAHPLMAELYRVARPGARLQVRAAHGAAAGAWTDPAWRRAWFEGSFAFFGQPGRPAVDADPYLADWQLLETRLVAADGAADAAPIAVVATLVAIKPARSREAASRRPSVAAVTVTDARMDPAFARP